jgi:ketosteroid isomerase-like protein
VIEAMDDWEVRAREGIRDTVAAYAHAGDRFRLDELAALFTEDGVLEVKGASSAKGRQAIVDMLTGSSTRRRPPDEPFFIRHFVTNLLFTTVEPDRAATSAYFLVLTPRGPDHWGRYRDVMVREGDRWLFEHRLAAVDAATPGSWFGAGEQ